MQNFFNKYSSKADDYMAIKLIYMELKKACEDMEKGDPDSAEQHLEGVLEMIEDYFQVKNYSKTGLQGGNEPYRGQPSIGPQYRRAAPGQPGPNPSPNPQPNTPSPSQAYYRRRGAY